MQVNPLCQAQYKWRYKVFNMPRDLTNPRD